jgi:N6-adenosine-specific RNA methylase IME4
MIITGNANHLRASDFPNRYGVVIADPPWPYQNFSERKQGAAAAEYDSMTIDQLCAMPVADLTLQDSILFLWGTWPKLPEAVKLLQAWGFDYVTGFPWVKLTKKGNGVDYGVGFWVRGCSEYVLIGRRGNVSPPRLEGFLGLLSPNLKHSRKPQDLYHIAETLPGPYLEIFSRRSRRGWDSYGNEVMDMSSGLIIQGSESQGMQPVQPFLFPQEDGIE